MKVVYIAGPFSSKNAYGVEQNIRKAEELALMVAKLGGCPCCPHSLGRFMGGAVPESTWISAGLELLIRCDAILVVGGWADSNGTVGEILCAAEEGLPVYYSIEDMLREGFFDA